MDLSRKKKILFSVTILLVLAMLSSAALAAGPGGNGLSSGQVPGQNEQGCDTGTGTMGAQKGSAVASGQAGTAAVDNGQTGSNKQQRNSSDKPSQSNGNANSPTFSENGKGDVTRDRDTQQLQDQQHIDIEGVNAAIAGLTDADVKENLNSLVEKYQNAVSNEKNGIDSGAGKQAMESYCEEVKVAKQALLGALDQAGVPQEQCIAARIRDRNQTSLNLGSIKKTIADLTDTDLQTSLSKLVTEYETAAANEKSAIKSGADEETLTIYRDATDSAQQALLDALDAQGDSKDAAVQSPQPQLLTQESGEGFFNTIFQWFADLFGIKA